MIQPLSLVEAAARIGANKSAVARWLREGKLLGKRMPGERGQWLIDPADVDIYIFQHKDDPHHRVTPPRDGYLSVTEAAELLGISRQAAYDRHRRGKWRMEKIDGRWYVPVGELEGD